MTSCAIIFTGPTLPPNLINEFTLNAQIIVLDTISDLIQELDENIRKDPVIYVLPPVSEGEIYKLTPYQPDIIGIIDGFFENIPSVWHKEILLAMSKGIHVYGASSMGALRAAELEAYGMVGVGSIFGAFRDSILNDDDEVTVVHAPRELGYLPLSEAMVNIRRTVDDAYNAKIIDTRHKELFLKTLKNTFYKDRHYGVLKDNGQITPKTLEHFFEWLENNKKDQKREDTLTLVKKIDNDLKKGLPKKDVNYMFEDTVIWRNVLNA